MSVKKTLINVLEAPFRETKKAVVDTVNDTGEDFMRQAFGADIPTDDAVKKAAEGEKSVPQKESDIVRELGQIAGLGKADQSTHEAHDLNSKLLSGANVEDVQKPAGAGEDNAQNLNADLLRGKNIEDIARPADSTPKSKSEIGEQIFGSHEKQKAPVVNVFNNKKLTTNVSAEQIQMAAQDQRAEVNQYGVKRENPNIKTSRQEVEEEELRKKQDKEQEMAESFEQPVGRKTGQPKQPKTKMRKKEIKKRTETKAETGASQSSIG